MATSATTVPEGIEFRISDSHLAAGELNRLYTVVGWNMGGQRTADKTASMLRTTLLHVSARSKGKVVGFGRMLGDAYVAQVLDVIVHPDYRQRGIAKGIMRLLLENLPAGLIGVSLVDGSGLPGFYESVGFEVADVEHNRVMYLRKELLADRSL